METSASSLGKTFKALGGMIVAAFSIKAITDFSKAAMEAAEVQMEAEVKLETVMRQRMNATDEGIQSIKDYASELQGIGIIGDEVTLSGAQQVATFLNSEEALKTLMPAMDNLLAQQKGLNATTSDAVNIGNMMGKVMQGQTSALRRVGITFSEAEENVLKYGTEEERAAMLAQIITNNVGDMNSALAQTPHGAVQQLKNNFGDLMEICGQFIVVAIQPMVTLLNKAVLAAQNLVKTLAEAFGVDLSNSIGGMASDLSDSADSAEDVADATEQTAKASKATTSFDELHKVNSSTSSGSSNTGGTTSGLTKSNITPAEAESKWAGVLDSINSKFKELKDNFSDGFSSVFKIEDLIPIKENLESIGNSVKDIFTNPKVLNSINTWSNKVAYALGQIVGSVASVGTTIGQFLTGSLAKYLDKNKGFIADRISAMFDSSSGIWEKLGDYAAAIADIFSVFRSDEATEIGSNIIAMFVNPLTALCDVLMRLSNDVLGVITGPIVDNAQQIKQVLQDLLGPLEQVTSVLAEYWTYAGEQLTKCYEEHFAPFFSSLQSGLTDLVSQFLSLWTEYVQPILDNLAVTFEEVFNDHVKPTLDKFFDLLGKIGDSLKEIWEKTLKPLISWAMDTIIPILAPIFEWIGKAVLNVFGVISDVVGDIFTILGGVIDFITGVLTGNWEKAWNGIKDIFKGVWDGLVDIVKTPINMVIDIINYFIEKINNALQFEIPDYVPVVGGKKWGVDIPTIPKLAKGGIATRETLATIGERGKEAVLPLENNTGWMDELAAKINRNGGNGEIHIHNYLFEGQEQFSEYVIKANEVYRYRMG